MSDELRTLETEVLKQLKKTQILTAQWLKEKGYSNVEIAKRIGITENTVRSLLKK